MILSSPVRRNKQTSDVLARLFGNPPIEEHEVLYSGSGRLPREQAHEAIKLVDGKGQDYDVIILSTHAEFLEEFPTEWGLMHRFRIKPFFETMYGMALVIDVATGQVERVYPVNS